MEEEKVMPVTPEPTPPKPTPVIVHKSNNAPLVGAIVFLALVIGATAFYFATLKKEVAVVATPSPTPAVQITTAPSPITTVAPEIASWKVLTHEKMKDLAFSAYSISYPEDWTAVEKKDDLISTVTITKGENVITIMQGPMGGNQCVFTGEMPEGPANDYRDTEYVDVNAGIITMRRIVPEGNTNTYSFCSNSIGSKEIFGVPTLFGAISYKVAGNNAVILSEMDKIVETLK